MSDDPVIGHFFDLGGTLVALDGDEVARSAANVVRPLPGVLDRLHGLAADGAVILVVTNQSGLASGALLAADVEDWFAQLSAGSSGAITDWAVCAHPADAGCPCRKPRPGLVHRLADRHRVDLSRSVYVGDATTDQQCAAAPGSRSSPGFGVLRGLGTARHPGPGRRAPFAADLGCRPASRPSTSIQASTVMTTTARPARCTGQPDPDPHPGGR